MRQAWTRLTNLLAGQSDPDEVEEAYDESTQTGGRRHDPVTQRNRVELTGEVRSVSVRPRSARVPALVVDLEFDKSREDEKVITLIWLGQRRIAGIRPGVRMRVRGIVTKVRGRTAIFNPAYELLPQDAPAKDDA